MPGYTAFFYLWTANVYGTPWLRRSAPDRRLLFTECSAALGRKLHDLSAGTLSRLCVSRGHRTSFGHHVEAACWQHHIITGGDETSDACLHPVGYSSSPAAEVLRAVARAKHILPDTGANSAAPLALQCHKAAQAERQSIYSRLLSKRCWPASSRCREDAKVKRGQPASAP